MLTACGKAILLFMTVANGASTRTSLIADPRSLSPPKKVMTVSNSLLKKEKDATVNVFMANHLATTPFPPRQHGPLLTLHGRARGGLPQREDHRRVPRRRDHQRGARVLQQLRDQEEGRDRA